MTIEQTLSQFVRNLPFANPPDGTEIAFVVQDGAAKKVPVLGYFTGDSIISGGTSPATSKLYWSGNLTGVASGQNGAFANSLIVTNDSLASTALNGCGNLQVQTTVNSTSLTGGVINFQSYLIVAGKTGNVGNHFYVSSNIWAAATSDDGGTGSGNNAKGSLFAINPQSLLNPGALNWVENTVQENNVAICAGASANLMYGMKVILTANNAVAAISDSAGYVLGIQGGGTNTLAVGYGFGQNGGDHGVAPTGALIGAGPGVSAVATGVDFSSCQFNTAAIKGPNSHNFVIQLGTTGSPRLFVINSGGNGAAVVVNGVSASITERIDFTPGVGASGAATISTVGTGTGGLSLQGGGVTGINIDPSGNVSAPNLATADPHVIGRLWRNSGVVTVSAG